VLPSQFVCVVFTALELPDRGTSKLSPVTVSIVTLGAPFSGMTLRQLNLFNIKDFGLKSLCHSWCPTLQTPGGGGQCFQLPQLPWIPEQADEPRAILHSWDLSHTVLCAMAVVSSGSGYSYSGCLAELAYLILLLGLCAGVLVRPFRAITPPLIPHATGVIITCSSNMTMWAILSFVWAVVAHVFVCVCVCVCVWTVCVCTIVCECWCIWFVYVCVCVCVDDVQ